MHDDAGHDDHDEIQTQRWCAGLRLDEERPLTANERGVLERNISAISVRMRTLWFAMAATAGIPLIAPLVMPKPQPAWLAATVTISSILVFFVGSSLCGLRLRDLSGVRRRFQRDLERGEMMSFTGTIGTHEVLDEEQKRLLDAGLLVPEPGAEQRLDVLPSTRAALAPGRSGGVRFVPVRVTEVAAGPEYAMRVAVPRHMAWIDGAPDAEIARRTLNLSERAEIDHHVRRLRRPNLWVALWLVWVTCWVLAATFSPVATLQYARERWILVAIQAAFLAVVIAHYVRALRLARLLEQDTDTGWALTLERAAHRLAEEPAEPVAVPIAVEEGVATPRCIEFLPHSRALWNEQGKPARWRNLGGRAA